MVAILLVLLLQSPATTGQAVDLSVSLERVREGLARPNRFRVPPPRPMKRPLFRLHVEQPRLLTGEAWDDTSLMPLWIRPSGPPAHVDFLAAVAPEEVRGSTLHPCCDVLPIVEAIGKRLQAGKRGRAQREVARTMRAAGIRRE